jgi:hypothetical protein
MNLTYSPHELHSLSPHEPRLTKSAVLFVLLEDEVVGHASDVVADYSGQRIFFLLDLVAVVVREGFGVVHPEGE